MAVGCYLGRYFLTVGGGDEEWRSLLMWKKKRETRVSSCPSQEEREDIRGGHLRCSGAQGPFSSSLLLIDATRFEVNGRRRSRINQRRSDGELRTGGIALFAVPLTASRCAATS